MRLVSRLAILSALWTLTWAAQAQWIDGIEASPASVRVGETVDVTVNLSATSGTNCGIEVFFGDGSSVEAALDDPSMLPFKTSHVYRAAGDFKVFVGGRSVRSRPNCGGQDQATMVKVAALEPPMTKAAALHPVSKGHTAPDNAAKVVAAPSASVAAPASAQPAAATTCTAPWKLVRKSVNKKTGAFTCSAKPGTALPAGKISCPGDLSYFENVKKGMFGCQP